MKVKKIIYEKAELNISGATLLSIEEAKKLSPNILESSNNWWLCSQGLGSFLVAFVYGGSGGACNYGYPVEDTLGVRPALKIENLELSTFKIGDKFKFKNYHFTIISNRYALCDKLIGHSVFRKDWRAKNANIYEASDIKKYIEKWMMESEDEE